jgi:hypothetical protein
MCGVLNTMVCPRVGAGSLEDGVDLLLCQVLDFRHEGAAFPRDGGDLVALVEEQRLPCGMYSNRHRIDPDEPVIARLNRVDARLLEMGEEGDGQALRHVGNQQLGSGLLEFTWRSRAGRTSVLPL